MKRNRVANYLQPPARMNAKQSQLVSHPDTFDILVNESEAAAAAQGTETVHFYLFHEGDYAVLPNPPTRSICFFVEKHENNLPFSRTIAKPHEKC